MKDSKPSTSSGLLNLDPHFLFSIRSDSYLFFESPNGLCDNICIFSTLRAGLSSPSMEDEDSASLYPPALIFFLLLRMLYTYPPPLYIPRHTCFSIPSLSQYYHSRFSSSVLQNCCKHWISKYWTIGPRENTGLGSWEPLITTFPSTNQYIILFYACSI